MEEDFSSSAVPEELINFPTFDNRAVYIMFTTIRDGQKETREELKQIRLQLVGTNRCTENRKQCIESFDSRFKEVFARLLPVEEGVASYKAIKDAIPSEADVLKVKEDTRAASRADDSVIISRLDSIDKKLQFLDLAWWSSCKMKDIARKVYSSNNKIIQGIFVLVAVGFIELNSVTFMVILGRMHDFIGWP